MKAKVIFNPAAGNQAESAMQRVELLRCLQELLFEPEVSLVQPDMDLAAVARRAVRAGMKWVIVSGGDGTIENVALGLVKSGATLGIVPTGTRNNLARSLGIPTDSIEKACTLLRDGKRLKVDVGQIRTASASRFFLEAGAVGLASALYPAADDIQHGDIGKIGEFISTFLSHTPSEIHLRLDGSRHEIVANAHLVLVANTQYMGANFRIAPDVAFDDARLDIFVYTNLSKLDLIGRAIQPDTVAADDRIQRYRARTLVITADPPMSIMADGVPLGEGTVTVAVRPHGLVVMGGAIQEQVPQPTAAAVPDPASS